MRVSYRLRPADRARIRELYADGLPIHEIGTRLQMSRATVSKAVKDIRRPRGGWVGGLCKCGANGFNPIKEQLDRLKLLEHAKAGEPIALRRLNAMGLLRWARADCGVIVGGG